MIVIIIGIIFIGGYFLTMFLYDKELKKRKPKIDTITHYHIIYKEPGKENLYTLYYGFDGTLTTEHSKAKTFYILNDALIAQMLINEKLLSNITIITETHDCVITDENIVYSKYSDSNKR